MAAAEALATALDEYPDSIQVSLLASLPPWFSCDVSNGFTIISGISFDIIFFVYPWGWLRWGYCWCWMARQTRNSFGITFCCWCSENKRSSCRHDIPDITGTCKILFAVSTLNFQLLFSKENRHYFSKSVKYILLSFGSLIVGLIQFVLKSTGKENHGSFGYHWVPISYELEA